MGSFSLKLVFKTTGGPMRRWNALIRSKCCGFSSRDTLFEPAQVPLMKLTCSGARPSYRDGTQAKALAD
jgi:hypothetical protein